MKARAAEISWSEALALTDTQIEERLLPVKRIPSSVKRPAPHYEYIYNELRTYRKINLTLVQLWLEYKEKHPDGYKDSQCCDLYRHWRGKLDYCMRQEHRAGEKAFIDYSDGLSILNRATGELILTQLFKDCANVQVSDCPKLAAALGLYQAFSETGKDLVVLALPHQTGHRRCGIRRQPLESICEPFSLHER